ncbi:MAG: hypothetical protein L3J82_00195 [Planctomycetes bacterium]|nr:hypothetical protein [Planctomycetota bacterium]
MASFRSLGGLTISDAKHLSKLDKLKKFYVHIYDSPSFMIYVVENMNIETLYFDDLGGDGNCEFFGSLCKSSIVALSIDGHSKEFYSRLNGLSTATGVTTLRVSNERMLSAILDNSKVWKSVTDLTCSW